MFNLLPAELRNHTLDNTDRVKKKLGRFLSEIPDQPTGCEEGRVAESNSLLHHIYRCRDKRAEEENIRLLGRRHFSGSTWIL